MRFMHRDGTVVHLAYCTNVHAAEDLDGVIGQLDRFALPVRHALGVGRLGLGLWLARDVAAALVTSPTDLNRLRKELTVRGLEVVTLNGFPYQGFHAPVVKTAVYRPDWSEPRRLAHTLDLAEVLVRLLPDDVAGGSVSTVPLGWRTPWPAERQDTARRRLDDLAVGLARTAARHGRPVRVGLEPEPGCVVETVHDATTFLAGIDERWLGVCLDACHLAVSYDDPHDTVGRLASAGLPVVKTQLSCALEAVDPGDPATRRALAGFVEPRFLHQVRESTPDGPVSADDLDQALAGLDQGSGAGPGALLGRDRWRVHFHVPVHAAPLAPLTSTRPVLDAMLAALFGGPTALTAHAEVETYTWHVLPMATRPRDDQGLIDGIAAELAWCRQQLLDLGLEELRT